jgi:hypothetical protein
MRAEQVAPSATPSRALPALSEGGARGWARPESSVALVLASWWDALWADMLQFWSAYVAPYADWWFLAIVIVFIVVVVGAYSAGENRGERVERRRLRRD